VEKWKTHDMAAARGVVSAQRPHCACCSLAAVYLLRTGRERLSWYRHVPSRASRRVVGDGGDGVWSQAVLAQRNQCKPQRDRVDYVAQTYEEAEGELPSCRVEAACVLMRRPGSSIAARLPPRTSTIHSCLTQSPELQA
jgi:hypothetical protein